MLTRTKSYAQAAIVCFLAATGALVAISKSAQKDVALLEPPREVVYTTRAPVATDLPKAAEAAPAAEKNSALRLREATPEKNGNE